MYRIMYLSRAVVKFSNEELEELLLKARQNNSKRNVTGLLILKGRLKTKRLNSIPLITLKTLIISTLLKFHI